MTKVTGMLRASEAIEMADTMAPVEKAQETEESSAAEEVGEATDSGSPAGQQAQIAPHRSTARPRRVGVVAGLIGIALLLAGAGGTYYLLRSRAKPETPPALRYYQKGLSLARAGNAAAAEQAWQTAIAFDSTFAAPYLAIADLYEQAGQPVEAAVKLNALRAADPNNPAHVECRQAELFFKADGFEKPLQLAREAVQRHPDCVLAHTLLGMALATAGDEAGAVAALRTAHERAPQSERITLTLAQTLAQAGRGDEAAALVKPLLSSPAASTMPVQANYLMGRIRAGQEGNSDHAGAARPYLQAALARDPRHAGSNAQMGQLLVRRKQFAAARPYLERARQGGDNGAATLASLALTYRALRVPGAAAIQQQADGLRAYDDALRAARRRYLAQPGDVKNNLALARLEARRGDVPDALDLLKSVLASNPNDSNALLLYRQLTVNPEKPAAALPPPKP